MLKNILVLGTQEDEVEKYNTGWKIQSCASSLGVLRVQIGPLGLREDKKSWKTEKKNLGMRMKWEDKMGLGHRKGLRGRKGQKTLMMVKGLWEEEQGKWWHGLEWREWNGNGSSRGKRNVMRGRKGKDKTLKERKLDHSSSENLGSWETSLSGSLSVLSRS